MTECRHDWQTNPRQTDDTHPWHCTHCHETSPTCAGGDHPTGTSLLLCTRCHRREEHVLADIARILAQGSGAAGGGSGPYRLVVVRGTGVDEHDRVTANAETRLLTWVTRWAEHTGPSQLDPTEYLASRLIWAVHNPASSGWATYRTDIRSIRGAALAEAGLAPEPLPDRCMHCDGRLVQDRADKRGIAYPDGLQDEVRCTRCGMTWPSPNAARVSARQRVHFLPDWEPDALVTLQQARQIFPDIPIETMRSWIRRDRREHERALAATDEWDDQRVLGATTTTPEAPTFYDREIPEHGTQNGRPLYRLGDLAAFATRRTSEGRRGRRAG